MKENPPKQYVLHVMGYHSEKFGALERYMLHLATTAKEEGLEIVFIFNKEPVSVPFIAELQEHKIAYYVTNALAPLNFWRLFYRLTKKYKPFLVHSHFQPLLPNLYAWVLGYKHRWHTVHLMLVNQKITEISSKSQLKLTSRIYRGLINRFTTRFLGVSQTVCNQYAQVYPHTANKIRLLYNGVQDIPYDKRISRETLGFTEDTIYFASIVFANKNKGVDILVEAFLILLKMHPNLDVKLCLIGLDPKAAITKKVHKDISAAGLQEKFIDFGIVDTIPQILPAMDIYIQPSRTESLSYALIEAGLFEIPTIGAAVGGIPEVILDGKTGFLFPVGDAAALVENIKILIENKDLRVQMGSASRKHKLASFGVKENLRSLISQYKHLP